MLELPGQGSSNEYPQSVFLAEIRKVYPCKPQFYCIKVGFKGVKLIWTCFCEGLCVKRHLFLCSRSHQPEEKAIVVCSNQFNQYLGTNKNDKEKIVT